MSDDSFDDIDDLLRSAAIARPNAEVEEELLLRMMDELATAESMPEVAAAEPVDVDLAAGEGGSNRPGSRLLPRLLAAAAVVTVVGGASLLLRNESPTTDTDPVTEPTTTVATLDIDVIDAACATHLPTLVAITEDTVPNDATDGAVPGGVALRDPAVAAPLTASPPPSRPTRRPSPRSGVTWRQPASSC